MWAALIILAILVTLAVWELWISEGAHLGRGFVVWLYDLTASYYDRIKQFDPDWERRTLGEPLAAAAPRLPWVKLLDVGAGTGRVARSIQAVQAFEGTIYNLDPSRRMISLGRRRVTYPRTRWLQAWAIPLPFAADTFDMVTCIEVLEFTPQPRETLKELIRVLRPGGWMLLTNRVGRQAALIVGHTFRRESFTSVLAQAGLEAVETFAWQVEYDLVWAQKPTRDAPTAGE